VIFLWEPRACFLRMHPGPVVASDEFQDRPRLPAPAVDPPFQSMMNTNSTFLEMPMWTKPEYSEMRFGFEVTMYIANR